MKRILIVAGPEEVNPATMDLGCYLGKLTKASVSGVLLQPAEYALQDTGKHTPLYKTEERDNVKTALSRFKDACICREANYSPLPNHSTTFEELIIESRFFDLIVLDPAITMSNDIESAPTQLARNISLKVACPVVLPSESFNSINEIVFAFDGSRSSVFAIKQFTYLFPKLNDIPVRILKVNHHSDNHTSQEEKLLLEWSHSHFNNIAYSVLQGSPVDKLIDYLFSRKNALLIIGAHNRSALSRLFKGSVTRSVSRIIDNPIFMTHF